MEVIEYVSGGEAMIPEPSWNEIKSEVELIACELSTGEGEVVSTGRSTMCLTESSSTLSIEVSNKLAE